MFIIDSPEKFSECTNCGKKPEIELTMGVTIINLCGDCAEMLGQMLIEAVEDEE